MTKYDKVQYLLTMVKNGSKRTISSSTTLTEEVRIKTIKLLSESRT